MFRSLCMMALLFAAAPAVAKSGGSTTWGKAGVSLPDYARDANECAEASRATDVSIKPDTLREMAAMSSAQLIQISKMMDDAPQTNVLGYVAIMDSHRSAEDIARRSNTFGGAYIASVRTDVVDELQSALDRCLSQRGYQKIRLTAEQSRKLSHLKRNTVERTGYLHALGSDAAIIERQRVFPAVGG